ncbi:MAG: signal peptidase I [Chloroflexi bacterium]|nr:signal peptidase I [Chloroflexota bacterium]
MVETLLLTFFIFWLVNGLIGRYKIDGSSMNPTLQDGQYLIINNISYYLDEPSAGEVIVFHHPTSELNLIKRVIGLPGDEIVIQDDTVSVNGHILDEPYIRDALVINIVGSCRRANTLFWGIIGTIPVIRIAGRFYRKIIL